MREGKTLLGLRSADRRNYEGRWDIIGGHVEDGEGILAALARELREEIGVALRTAALVRTFHGLEPLSSTRFHLHLYHVVRWKGEPELRSEGHERIAWFDSAEISRLTNLADPSMTTVLLDLLGES